MKKALTLIMLLSILTGLNIPANSTVNWDDTFYQYRIPVKVKIEKAGWNIIPVDEKMITDAVNELEELKYSPDFFAYNYLKVVEVTKEGEIIDANPEAGFYMVPAGEKRSVTVRETESGQREAMFEGPSGMPPKADKKDEVVLPVEPFEYYLFRYTSQGGGSSPTAHYRQVYPIGAKRREHGFYLSYEQRLLPLSETKQKTLILPDADSITLRFVKRFITNARDVSLQKVKIVLLVNIKNPGTRHFMLYYQPMCASYLMVPEKERRLMPQSTAIINSIGAAEKFSGNTRYTLSSNNFFSAWFGESTVKLTPSTPLPTEERSSIRITSAKNERQSFQLILSPKRPLHFENISVSNLKMGEAIIPASTIDLRVAAYVPIHQSSYVTPAKYIGLIADPLVKLEPGFISPDKGNFSTWITIPVAPGTAAGTYKGTVTIQTKERSEVSVPLEITVNDFTLPEYSPFQSDMGGSSIYKSGRSPIVNADYHGIKTKEDLQKLADSYFEEMAVNKFNPSNCALYTEVGLKWSPPPKGYNVDAPNNYIKLYDWDFIEYNKKLDHYINKLKVNSLCVYHTNPKTCGTFHYLPTEKLEKFNRKAPKLMMGHQIYRDFQFFAYDLHERHPYYNYKGTIEITRDQFDHLLLDYLRAIAKNLDENGWLEYATILVDESHHNEYFLHFLRTLKSDPLVSRIRVGVCMQGQSYLYYKENPNDENYAYNNLLDYYIPEINETYNRWEDYFFDDYNITRDRKKLMPYGVTTSRSAIDVPGMTNRILPMHLFQRGASGFLIWSTFNWQNAYKDWQGIHPIGANPWLDPFGRHGNGALSFFYPPQKDGFTEEPDFTITPSARVMMWREGVDDYEYAWMLEQLAAEAREKGIDTSAVDKIFEDIDRYVYSSVHWSQNDAWYLDLRDRIAAGIIALEKQINMQ